MASDRLVYLPEELCPDCAQPYEMCDCGGELLPDEDDMDDPDFYEAEDGE